MGQSQPLFLYFVFSTVNSKYIQYKILPMTGFEPQISGTGSNRSANCATNFFLSFKCEIFWKIFVQKEKEESIL